MRREVIGALALILEVHALQQVREPVPDDVQVPRVELFLLHQHLLAHADFAEVMQQAGVAQLAQLCVRELHVAVFSGPAAIDGFRQVDGQLRDAAGMTRRGRIALLDGGDGRGHETLEQLLDVLVQQAVLDCDRRL